MTNNEACLATKGFLEYVNKKQKEMRFRECSFTLLRTNIPLKPVIAYGEMTNVGEQAMGDDPSIPLTTPGSTSRKRRLQPSHVRSLGGIGSDVDNWPLCLSGSDYLIGANQTIEELDINDNAVVD